MSETLSCYESSNKTCIYAYHFLSQYDDENFFILHVNQVQQAYILMVELKCLLIALRIGFLMIPQPVILWHDMRCSEIKRISRISGIFFSINVITFLEIVMFDNYNNVEIWIPTFDDGPAVLKRNRLDCLTHLLFLYYTDISFDRKESNKFNTWHEDAKKNIMQKILTIISQLFQLF